MGRRSAPPGDEAPIVERRRAGAGQSEAEDGDEDEWEPPGPGVWWFTREHFPVPVSRLFATLFPLTVVGWQRAAARYGWPIESTTFAVVNGWLYYSPGTTDWDASLALEPVAERTLATQSWREEIDRWYDEERPLVLEQNLALQGEDLAALGDAELAGHIDRAIAHFAAVAPAPLRAHRVRHRDGSAAPGHGRVGDRRRRGRRVARGRVTRHIGGAEPPRHDRARPDFGADLARRDARTEPFRVRRVLARARVASHRRQRSRWAHARRAAGARARFGPGSGRVEPRRRCAGRFSPRTGARRSARDVRRAACGCARAVQPS